MWLFYFLFFSSLPLLRFYVDIGIASLVLLIFFCFAAGLTFGCCGKRPVDPYDDDFGTKGTGASCLMA